MYRAGSVHIFPVNLRAKVEAQGARKLVLEMLEDRQSLANDSVRSIMTVAMLNVNFFNRGSYLSTQDEQFKIRLGVLLSRLA